MNIIFTYPAWFIILCILCGGLFAVGLYLRDKKLNELKTWLIKVLAIIRFVSVFFIAFLLLEPLFENTKTTKEKPIVVFAHDNSESIVFTKDSAYVKNDYKSQYYKIRNSLSEQYEVVSYSFGNELFQQDSISFKDKETNLSNVISGLNERYYNRNLGAIILATDGIYNKGSNPFFAAQRLKNIPVYTIALGDTNPAKDLYIDQVINNRLAYKGNDFPVEVTVKANDFNSAKSTLKILKQNKVVSQREVIFTSKNDIQTLSFQLEASATGLQRYQASISPLKDEYTTQNNTKDFYIDVLESKQKILILANAPHPDIAAFKNAIETNKNYEVSVSMIDKFDNKIDPYSLVLLHNLPSTTNYADNVIKNLTNKKTAMLFVLGSQTFYKRFNNLKKGLSINYVNNLSNAQGSVNSNFSLFKFSDALKQNIPKFPPLKVPFSQQYKLENSCEVLAYQKIGLTTTKYPLIVFNRREGNKTGFLIGEGYYKWKYFDYLENENNTVFQELITQTVQYAVSKEDKSFFRVFSNNDFKENEEVFIEAEVYNKSYELDNSNEVSIVIKDEDGKEFPYNFSKTNNRYELKAGILPPGNYNYVAKTIATGKTLTETGEFSVTELKVEQTNTVANHQLLYNISDLTNGKLFYPNQLNELQQDLENREDLVPVLYDKKDVDDLINLKYIFFLILALLATEWFLRKRNGAY